MAGNHIAIKGKGSANPVGDNKTKRGRAKNRRVAIRPVINGENLCVRINMEFYRTMLKRAGISLHFMLITSIHHDGKMRSFHTFQTQR